jgi:hypothetical protein
MMMMTVKKKKKRAEMITGTQSYRNGGYNGVWKGARGELDGENGKLLSLIITANHLTACPLPQELSAYQWNCLGTIMISYGKIIVYYCNLKVIKMPPNKDGYRGIGGAIYFR